MTRSIRAIVKPALLVWARETAALSQEVAAKAVGVSPDRLQAWEAGTDSPTMAQLRKMAERYKRPLSVFYLPKPPKDFQALKDFRRIPGASPGAFSPQLAYEVRAAFERRLVALDVLEELGERPTKFGIRAKRTESPEKIARELRERLSITPHQQFRWGNHDAAFRAWRDALERAGILVFQLSGAHHQIDVAEMRGFAIAETPLPTVVINGNDHGKVFTLLHEVGHIILGESIIENTVEPGDDLPAPNRALERFCNRVAAATLMPRDLLESEPLVATKTARSSWSDEDISYLAKRFAVSREALLIRLVELDRLSQSQCATKRALYERQRLAEPEKDSTGFAPYRYQVLTHIGRGFARLILQGYHEGRLTLSAVAGHLNVQAKHVTSIESAAFGMPA